MRRFSFFFLFLPAAAVIILLSVANRAPVTLSLDPLGTPSPAWSLTAPLFVFLFAALVLGVVIGGTAAWFGQARWRRAARAERAAAAGLRRELERQRRPAPVETPVLPAPLDGMI